MFLLSDHIVMMATDKKIVNKLFHSIAAIRDFAIFMAILCFS
jgi:hypothetical protein